MREITLYFTPEERDRFDESIHKAYAIADLLNCIYHGPSDGPELENLGYISAILFEHTQDIARLWEKGAARKEPE